MELKPEEIPWKSMYKLMIGSIVPRPIGWISSLSLKGVPNLAPFSFFNVVCAKPPMVLFCPMVREIDKQRKDTLENVRTTGEFVVNIVTEDLAQAMNITSTDLLPEVDEFELAGLTPAASVRVKPPRVAESPIHYECRLAHIYDVGDWAGSGSIVIGEVVYVHVDPGVLIGENKIDILKVKPIGRLAGAGYCRVTDLFEMPRPGSQILKEEDPETSVLKRDA